jgi:hypothetical protein
MYFIACLDRVNVSTAAAYLGVDLRLAAIPRLLVKEKVHKFRYPNNCGARHAES